MVFILNLNDPAWIPIQYIFSLFQGLNQDLNEWMNEWMKGFIILS